MQKNELIQLHSFLLQLRLNLETRIQNCNPKAFIEYDKLETSPHEIYKSKKEQEIAVFEICKGISMMLDNGNGSNFKNIYDRFTKLLNNL